MNEQTLDLNAIIAATAIAAISWLSGKVYDRLSSKTQEKIAAGIATVRHLISQVVLTTRPDVSIEELIAELEQVADRQLRKLGVDPTNTVVKALVREAISAGVSTFIDMHPDRYNLELPARRVLDAFTPKGAIPKLDIEIVKVDSIS